LQELSFRQAEFLMENLTCRIAAGMVERSEGEAPRGEGENLKLVFTAAPFAILVADEEGRYVDANPAACALLDHAREDILGKRVFDFVDVRDLASMQDHWRSFQAEKRGSGEFRLLRRDGGRPLLRYRVIASGTPGLNVSFLEDVTASRSTQSSPFETEREEALAPSEVSFRTLADGLPLVVWIGDATGRHLYFNQRWYEYTGLPRPASGESSAAEGWQVVHPDDRARLEPAIEQARTTGGEFEATYRLRRHDGVYRWHLVRSRPVRNARGEIVQRLASVTDIEDQRQGIESLQQERELRERFVAALSHDLRSPIAAVKLGAYLVQRRAGDAPFCQTQAKRISSNAEHADQLIHNLLDASRISAGETISFAREPCDLSALLDELIADQITMHGNRFELDAQAGVSSVCDPGAIRRTLANLIGNAIKHGQPRKPVRVTMRERDGEIALSVHNQGNPIPPEEQGKIFQPYHRARGNGGGAKGWGLGLTLVRGTAEAHGGSVRVESSPEAGTTFTVTLRKGA
jgi:PAS domain S-box-containing protein